MFGKDKSDQSGNQSGAVMSSGGSNSLVQGTSLEGNLKANSDIRIDGHLTGKLECSGRLIIGGSGVIDGEVDCQNAIIEGKFIGKLNVKELLDIRESADVSGDVSTNKLLIQAGAIFNVNCDMGGRKIKSKKDQSS